MSEKKKCGRFRLCLKWGFRIFLLIVLILAGILGYFFREGIYKRYFLFPKQAKAWAQFKAERVEPGIATGWHEYRGMLHSHSELSHDSAAAFPEIVAALKKIDVDFICMTDHYEKGLADYSLGWNGMHGGILFIRGYELDHGLMPWGIPEGTVFAASDEPRALAKRIRELGAVLFYSHTEKDRMWDLPELEGMEIYNIHTDYLEEPKGIIQKMLPQLLLTVKPYPQQSLRIIFDPPAGQLARWDDLNRTRHITGIAANDTHQNVGVRAIYTPNDTVILKGTGEKHKIIKEFKLNFLTRALLKLCCGPLTPDQEFWRFELDAYHVSGHHVNTHVLAKDLTEESILDALRAGRAFVAFTAIADATGFITYIEGDQGKVVMGESIAYQPGMQLVAAAPNQCRFLLLNHGKEIARAEGARCTFDIPGPGKYRIEAHLNILGEWTPWIYANPIEVTETAPEPPALPAPAEEETGAAEADAVATDDAA